ncbi:DNA double-strand break repair nuclease NurA [Methanocella conradii]|uniref:DNA double-strand break repair nuclease NurA n=1 Tax=Methanocella conradii TaxID=1175444 RepID=UPI00157CECBE|nr:DNA double-strand break repair nuclease NurA [Methanocella conradii]
MLDLRQLSLELSEKKDDILGFEREESQVMSAYKEKLPLIDALDMRANDRLPLYSGCKVLEEGAFIRRFSKRFMNRGEATDWAMEVLRGKTIAAVDGSQVYASRGYSVPIGLAQAGLVINRHTGADGFSASYKLSLVLPREFEEHGGMSAYSPVPVSLKRHQLECKAIIDFMRSEQGNLVFFDGSLVLSFISQLEEKVREQYAASIIELMEASEDTQTPVVAYTDMSLNKDLVTMMRHYYGLPLTTHLVDAYLLDGKLNWGDRTRAFLSDREDRDVKNKRSTLDLYGPYRDSVAFFYIQSGGGLPSKIEVPRWVYEKKMLDMIADVVRAECIIRPGYPEIIHRAHEHTMISQPEVDQFNRMLEGFATKNGIKIYKSAKEQNKRMVHKA